MAVKMDSRKSVNRTVSHLPGVIGAVKAEAQDIGRKAEANLAGHVYEGRASISVTYGDVDAFVNLNDPDNALAIETGHNLVFFGVPTDKRIRGLHILGRAAGLL
jgi:hypothetical protein